MVTLNQVPAGQLLHNAALARLYSPAGQTDAVALVDPAGQEYPAEQLAQAPAPLTLYRPAGQSTAVALADPGGHAYPAVQAALQALGRAVSPLHVPAAQSVQAAAPARLNRPAGHAEAVPLVDVGGHAYPAVQLLHTPAPTRLNWLAGQANAVALVEPAGQEYPALQAAAQAVVRAVSMLHVPAVQSAHEPAPDRLNRPAGQVSAVALVEPAGQEYPAVQGPLQSAEFRPTADKLNHLPAGQSLHAPAPARLYLPVGHTDAVASVDPAGQEYPAVQGPLQAAVLRPTADKLNHVPAGQSVHTAAPARLYLPPGHTDAVALVDAAGQEYPAVQAAVQALVRAVPLLHLPAVQSAHEAAPERLNRPAGHTDAVALVEPVGQKYPAVQGPLHAAVLTPTVDTLNHLPAGQSVHTAAPARLYLPARHTDAVALVDPAGQEYPAVQGPLHAAVLRPTADTLNHLPAGQSLHDPAPARLYLPAGHTDAVALVDPAGQEYPAVQGPLHAAELRPTADTLNQAPAGQSAHTATPARLYWPARHTDAVALVDPAGQEYPAAQAPLQARVAKDALLPHLPGPHWKQPMESSLNVPNGQEPGFRPVRDGLAPRERNLTTAYKHNVTTAYPATKHSGIPEYNSSADTAARAVGTHSTQPLTSATTVRTPRWGNCH